MRPHVKICGITRREDADAAIALGAEFIGLNFYAGSPRHVVVEEAASLRRHIADARVVARFVHADWIDVEFEPCGRQELGPPWGGGNQDQANRRHRIYVSLKHR